MSAARTLDVDTMQRQHHAARFLRRAWIAGAAVVLLPVCVQSLNDSDVWWQLAGGRFIAQHGLPAQEPFSFLTPAHAVGSVQWLYQLLLAGLMDAGGPTLTSLAMGAVGVAAIVIAALAVPRDTRVPGMWLAACMLLSALVMAAALGVRSQVFSLVGVAVVLLVVRQWREGRRGVVWLLPPLFLLWANLDGGFIAGLAVLGVAALVAGPLDPSVIAPRRLLGTVLLASALATLLNPDAAGLYAHLVDAALHSPIGPALAATGSPDFHSTGARLFEVEAALLIAVWAAGGGPDRFDALVAGGALLATLLAQGSTGLFAVVAIPQLAVYGHRTWRMRLAARTGRRALRAARRASLLAAGGLAAVSAASAVTLLPHLTPTAEAAYESAHYPRAAADYIAAHLAGQRIYTIDTWGGYLAYRFPTVRAVFVYDQPGAFSNAALQSYLDLDQLRPGWPRALAGQGIDHAVVPLQAPEATALHELGWIIDCHDRASSSVVMSATAPQQARLVTASALTLPLRDVPDC